MKKITVTTGVATAALLLSIALSSPAISAQSSSGQMQQPMSKVDQSTVDTIIATWKAQPKKVAQQMIQKYGLPQEASANRLIWTGNGPWKWSELVNQEIDHRFPMPHKDMLYQAISYKVDPRHATDLLTYDGSVILERTKGEIAARCDKEEANFLAINLANDIATGKRDVEGAREYYAKAMMQMMKEGTKDPYLTGFKFEVPRSYTGDPDKPAEMVGTTGKKPGR